MTTSVDDYTSARAPKGGHRLRLPPDHRRSDREGAARRAAAAGPRRHHLVQGLHDLRAAAARATSRCWSAGGGADASGALVMVHAENHEHDPWLAKRLLERGHDAPKLPRDRAHARIAEAEATNRVDHAVAAARRAGADRARLDAARRSRPSARAQTLGAQVYAETCPQYLFLTAEDIDRPGVEGAKWCCSPPPRDEAAQEAIWAGLADGTFQVYSSDHAPYRFDETGKLPRASRPPSRRWRTACRASRCACRCSSPRACGKRRLTLEQFVALDGDQPCAHVRPLPAQGHHRGRLGRRHRHLGSRESRRRIDCVDDARRRRLYALRGPCRTRAGRTRC